MSHCNQKSDDMPREEYTQLARACDFLEHYHTHHTKDMITRFKGKGGMPDILVVGDEEWKKKLREFCAPAFPPERQRDRSVVHRFHRRRK